MKILKSIGIELLVVAFFVSAAGIYSCNNKPKPELKHATTFDKKDSLIGDSVLTSEPEGVNLRDSLISK